MDSFSFPEFNDTSGSTLVEGISLRALDYNGLISLLVSGVNELNEDKVSTTATDSNYVPKWSSIANVLQNSNIYDNGTNVGIGIADNLDGARLWVLGENGLAGIYAQGDTIGATFTGGQAGVYAFTDSVIHAHAGVIGVSENATVTNIGIMGSAGGVELPGPEDQPMNIGVAAFSGIPTENKSIGLAARAFSSTSFNAAVYAASEEEADTAINAGVIAFAGGSDGFNVGGLFGAEDSTGINIGIFCSAEGSDSNSAGHFVGNITVTGSVYEGSYQKLKTNIADMDSRDALATINALQPKSYEYRTADYDNLSLPEGTHHGLIAQDVEQVLPELVRTVVQPEVKGLNGRILSQKTDYKGVNYSGLVPYLVSAIKQQQAIIDSLEAALNGRLSDVESKMNNCCGMGFRQSGEDSENGSEEANHVTVELASHRIIDLSKNHPNPFRETTSISYVIPDDAGKAQLIFFDVKGSVIKTVELEKGYGSITVLAHNLTSGTYSYSLVIDGEVVETKRMVKMK